MCSSESTPLSGLPYFFGSSHDLALANKRLSVSLPGGSFHKLLTIPRKELHLVHAMSCSCYPAFLRPTGLRPGWQSRRNGPGPPWTCGGTITALGCTVSPLWLNHHHLQIPVFLLHTTKDDPNQYVPCAGRSECLNETKCPK